MHSLFVGIAGPSCSGKTTLIRKLVNRIGEKNVEIIHADDYWDRNFKPPLVKGYKNRELPENINSGLLFEHLSKIREGKSVDAPFNVFEIEGGHKLAEPKKFVFVEGFLLFYWQKIRDLFDLKVYYDISDEEIVRRRTARARSGKKDREAYYRTVVIDEYRRFGRPNKKYADLSLDGEESMDRNIQKILGKIASFKSVSK
ncbi:MAG: hypothetical protein ABH864_06215 [archaeon]